MKKKAFTKTCWIILTILAIIITYCVIINKESYTDSYTDSYTESYVESYTNGQPISFPPAYCSNKTTIDDCQTNWTTDGYTLALQNNGISLPGNPCSWDNSACSISSSSAGWNYTFNGSS